MSLIYCKSQQYLEDENGSAVMTSGELPYRFNNQFKSPIRIEPGNKIELISADLNVLPLNDISTHNDNDNFTFAFGRNDTGYLQKVSKIPTGTYNKQQLANAITNTTEDNNNLDMCKLLCYTDTLNDGTIGDFQITMDSTYDATENETPKNDWAKYTTKMGYQSAAADRNIGAGDSSNTITITNKNSLTNPHSLVVNDGNIPTPATTYDTTKGAVLISNLAVPTTHGVFQGAGSVNAIFQPLKHYLINPATFLAGIGANNNFEWYVGAVLQWTTGTIVAYAGANGYDMIVKNNLGVDTLWLKFMTARTGVFPIGADNYNLPNATTWAKVPFGNFLIIRFTDAVINTTLDSNELVMILKPQINSLLDGWERWGGSAGAAAYKLSMATAAGKTYLQTAAVLTKLGNQGAGCLGLTRGELGIVGTNQANTTTYESRIDLYNDVGLAAAQVNNEINCDYVLKITPHETLDDCYISVDFGVQATTLVAGEVGWNPMTEQMTTDPVLLSALIPSCDQEIDNVMLTAVIYNYQCVKFYISHDTDGDLTFLNLTEVAHTEDENITPPATSLEMPQVFNEMSYPIMPFVGTCGYACAAENNVLVQGNYSPQLATTKNLAKLYAKVNSAWSLGAVPPATAYTIPPRQIYVANRDVCFSLNMEDRVVNISPDGFSAETAVKTFTLPDTQPDIAGNTGYEFICIRLGDFTSSSSYNDTLTRDGFWTYVPTRLTKLYQNLGFEKLLINEADPDDPDARGAPLWNSTSEPLPNGNPNYIVNLDNMGRIQGQNSTTGSISQIIGVIPNAELASGEFPNDRHFRAQYSLPVKINAVSKENINNFNIYITKDNGKPADNLDHPTNLVLRIT